MSFNKLPIMGKNVEVTLKYKTVSTNFQVEPEKWSEKRVTVKTTRKPLGIGQKPIERSELQHYELTFGGAKVSNHLQQIVAIMDDLNSTGDAMSESDIAVTIEITNPNNADVEVREYTLISLQDPNTDAQDLEGNIEESFTLTAKTRKLTINGVEITASSL